MLFGRIDEPIKDEPIHLFRIREGTPLTLVSQDSMMTKDDGVFSTGSLFVNDAILLSYSWGSIRLFENTWLPSGWSLSLRMTPATSTSAMSIIYSRGSLDIIRNTLIPPDTLRISDQSSSLPVSSPSLQITKIWNVRFLRAPLDDRSIPWGYYLTDTQGIPLVAFDRRWQIYLLDSTTTLTPSIDPSGYLLVTVKKWETSIATALYSVDFFFTMKK